MLLGPDWTTKGENRKGKIGDYLGRLAVNGTGNHLRGRTFAANFNFDGRAGFGQGGRHVTQPDTHVERRALRAADDLAHLGGFSSGAPNRVVRTRRRRFVGHGEGDTLAGGA